MWNDPVLFWREFTHREKRAGDLERQEKNGPGNHRYISDNKIESKILKFEFYVIETIYLQTYRKFGFFYYSLEATGIWPSSMCKRIDFHSISRMSF